MRELHPFDDPTLAARLLAVLNTSGLPAFLDEEDGKAVLWIRDDDHRAKAKEILTRFLSAPDAPEFVEAEQQAARISEETIRREATRRRRMIDLRDRWNGVRYRTYPATVVMICLSVLVAFATTDLEQQNGWSLCNSKNSKLLPLMYMQEPTVTVDFAGFRLELPGKVDLLATLRSGQIWRFVSPIFLHFSILHIFFNMSIFRDLGFAVEFVKGTRRFLVIVLIIAVISNIAQVLWSGPRFGGMSGVIYGLIGYLWIKGRFQPEQGLGLSPNQIVWSVLFLLLCIGGAIPNVANACHIAGLITGIVIGLRQTVIRKLKRLLRPPPDESRAER
ncbi:MAG: rhomboid family intramembrane serine protease [Planctomycetota bacterium]